ncbi:lytic transglycosylase domain-containing protein [Eleftheria terrae]|uniref:lytic transglycosylase domain-containing protein n=1 Tax=Eleftheria terrae TaxID=1597781 RepID=UPI00263A6AF1|nr:lytic transglycosylase domain-containing protein [Eleftheria terrae]WKB51751.1 lytic transglycosylase domain-containing protein [Eleftheria terrae]
MRRVAARAGRWRRRCRGAWLAALLLAWHGALQAGERVTRFRCTLLDGTVKVVAQDLSRLFTRAAPSCEAFEVDAALLQPPPPPSGGRAALAVLPGWSEASRRLPVLPLSRQVAAAGLAIPEAFAGLVREASRRHGLDPRMVAALIHVESGYRPTARSPKGALGLMQIMPATGARYGVHSAAELLQPAVNIDVGTRYLRDLSRMFDGELELILAAYNAGEGAVAKYGRRIPPYRETRDYVRKITALYGAQVAQR